MHKHKKGGAQFLATPYKRSFNNGRASELLFNEELHKMYESTKHLTEDPGANAQPVAKLHQAIWHDERNNKLKWWDKTQNKWRDYYEAEHRITGEMMSILPPSNPIYGQLWLHNGVLCYFDGSSWTAVKALIQDGSQFSLDVFKNFILLSPLWQSGNTVTNVEEDGVVKYTTVTNVVTIAAEGQVEIDADNLDKKSLKVLYYDNNASSRTYGTYVEPYINLSKWITVSYTNSKVIVYNPSNSAAQVKIIYQKPKLASTTNEDGDLDSSTGRLTGINYEILTSTAVEEFRKQERMYLQNVLDTQTDSAVTGDGTKWTIGKNCISNEPNIPVVDADAMSQLLVPQIDYARIFLDRNLDTEKYQEVSKVCIQYKRKDIINHIPSLVHINPGRLTKMEKTIVKIDRTNPKILITAENTEYYGFKSNSPYGELLVPDSSTEKFCDYTIIDGGILLSYNACQNFDYVLAIHYTFSWMKSTGALSHASSADSANVYTIDGFKGHINMFVEGYDLEDPYFSADSASETVTFAQDVNGLEVSAIHSPKTEYGYVRKIDIKGNAVIKPLTVFKQGSTLVFMNGELVHPTNDGMVWNSDGTISIPNGKIDMMWSALSLHGTEEVAAGKTEDYIATVNSGLVDAAGHINYTAEYISATMIPMVFVDGLLVTKEDIKVDEANKIITIANTELRQGQEYVVIEDKFGWFYDSAKLTPALSVGAITDTLVYMNGKLLCNDTALDVLTDNIDGRKGVYNEVKCFKTITLADDGVTEIANRDYRIYDSVNEVWNPCTDVETTAVKTFGYSYDNARKSIHMNIKYTAEDNIQIYAYNTANAVEHPLEIHTIIADNDHPILTVGSGMYWDEEQGKEVSIADDPDWATLHPDESNWNKLETEYLYGKNTLRVWLNGIRQYPYTDGKCDGIKEALDGLTFTLPEPFVGQITYIVELPEDNQSTACSMEVLDHTDIKNGYINFYKTQQSLFPGRTTLYINGIRQPENAYTVFDNNTLLINDTSALIGCHSNYPTEAIQIDPATKRTISWPETDKLLIEVRQDERTEFVVTLDPATFFGEIKLDDYDVDINVLEASDELLIFADGIYTSIRLNDGYKLNISRGSIMITDPDVNNIIRSDGEYEYLAGHPDEHAQYLISHNNEDYKRKTTDMIIEWR